MSQVEKLIENVEERYKVSVSALIERYTEGDSREQMATTLGSTPWTIRVCMTLLNLRSSKKFRANDYSRFLERFKETGVVASELKLAHEDLEFVSKALFSKEKQLANLKAQLSAMRRGFKQEVTADAYHKYVDDVVASLGNPMDRPVTTVRSSTASTQFIVLSDLHLDELVKIEDVGSTEFNWEEGVRRIDRMFTELALNRRGEEELHVYILGDLLSSLIHGAQENASNPVVKAVAELSEILATHINILASSYNSVEVFCVNGNHSRLEQQIKSHNKGYDFEYLIFMLMKSLCSQSENVSFDISTTGYAFASVGGRIIALTHGDLMREPKGEKKNLKLIELCRQQGYNITHSIQGHTHMPSVDLLFTGGYSIVNGSMIGTNSYAHSNSFLGLPASQFIGSWNNLGDLDHIKNIVLN